MFKKGHKINKGRQVSPEERLKRSVKMKGKPKSEETKARMRTHKKTPEHIAKVAAALKGKAKSPEHRLKLKEALGGSNILDRQIRQAGRPKPEHCEICGSIGRICFDHDHATGLFRGWICHRCNLGLGYVSDDTEILEKMITYLNKIR